MPGFVAVHLINNIGLETALFGPAHVHPQEHLRPVRSVRAARPGVNRQDRAASVAWAGKQQLKFSVFQVLGQPFDFAGYLRAQCPVILGRRQLKQFAGIADLVFNVQPTLHLAPQRGKFSHRRLR